MHQVLVQKQTDMHEDRLDTPSYTLFTCMTWIPLRYLNFISCIEMVLIFGVEDFEQRIANSGSTYQLIDQTTIANHFKATPHMNPTYLR